MNMATETVDCGACKGHGGTYEDRWGSAGHYTYDTECVVCEGTGIVPARCECGSDEHVSRDPESPNGYTCAQCRREMAADDRIPTAPEGVPVTMAQLVAGVR
jgi:hypothetical protein